MLNDKIVNFAREDNKINSLYFVMARSQFLKKGERKGILNISIDDPEQYLNYLEEKTEELPKMQINYEKDCMSEYDPNEQFILYLETKESQEDDDWATSQNIINSIVPHKILYSETVSLSGSEFNQEDHILNTPCAVCERISKVKLEEPPYESKQCDCCEKRVFIKFIYECTKCCTQYAYKSNSL